MESSQQKYAPNPRDSTNIFAILFFSWTIPLFKKGYGKILQLEDMFRPLKSDHSNVLGDRLEKNWLISAKLGYPSIVKVVANTFWTDYVVFAIVSGIHDVVLRLIQPFLLGQLLRYFREDAEVKYEEAFWYAIEIIAITAAGVLIMGQVLYLGYHLGMKIRISVCSLVYRKALRLSQTALGETAPGKMVNLLSNDVNRLDLIPVYFTSLWSAPLFAVCVSFLLWEEAGIPGIIGLIIMLITVPIQSYTGKLSSKYRSQTALRTDERIRFMDEIISGVQVIKMYAWEKPFSKLITQARRKELNIIRKSGFVRGLYMTFMLFTTRMAIFCAMLSIVLLYGADQITAVKVFVMTAYFTNTAQSVSQMFVRGVAETAEALVAFKRIQNFLLLDEKEMQNSSENFEPDQIEVKNVSVLIKNATARWIMPKQLQEMKSKSHKIPHLTEDQNAWKSPTLNNINVKFPKGKLIGIIGPVGSGKSSFLQALLRELPFESGSMSINGSLSYACQEPWVFAASVRQNILFGETFDRDRYDVVVETCALGKDFQQFENGDRTLVGDRGISLSGGQKARLNLARACYRNADIYLLDDPLSSVDAHVGIHIFNKCIGPNSRLARLNATRILVTHQVHFLKEADWLVILNDGKIEAQGTPADLSKSGVNFAELIRSNEFDGNESIYSRPLSQSSSKHSSMGSSNASLNKENGHDGVGMEASSKGKINGSIALHYFRAGANWLGIFVVCTLFVLAQVVASTTDCWVSFWVSQEEIRRNHVRTASSKTDQNFSDTLVVTDSGHQRSYSYLFSTDLCIIIHGTMVTLLFLFAISRSVSFFVICSRASQKLHNSMFNGVISATMRFFDTNPSGRILNRFSKDIGATDDNLTKVFLDATQSILSMTGSLIVAFAVNPYFLIPIAVMGILFIFIRKVYLKTSKNIKRLESIAKSPVFTHLAATLNGLSTVRAYKAERILEKEFDHHQDIHSACWYQFLSTSIAFGLSLDLMCFAFVTCIVGYYILIDTGAPGEQIGLVITQSMTLIIILQWGVRQSADVSNQLMAVERVLEYRDLEPEKQPKTPRQVPADWPTEGKIEFQNLFYKYYEEGEPVLRGLSFVIESKEKIGIVGRTGAGKSSLIGALFRLACIDGEILIDGIDTATVHLSELRKRIAIIPQDPVLFSGTLRRNLDPFEEYSDDNIWNALEKVELKEVAAGPLGLLSAVMAHGSNYSVGQRQLLCLARAILRKNRILVLDEATANVDPQTDKLIQLTIRERFADCTVLTIAHRLHTIIDSDRILVMDTGRAIEFDEPYNVLQNNLGTFYSMAKALGPHEFKRLFQIAHNEFFTTHGVNFKYSNL